MRLDRFYIRLINFNAEDSDLSRDIPDILSIVQRFEGAGFGKGPELHVKGGYSVFISCDDSQVAGIIQSLYESDYRPVL